MKTILFALALAFSCSFASATQISGTLQKGKKSIYLTLEGKGRRYLITYTPSDAIVAFNKLNTGDYLVGNGDVDDKNRTINLNTLDYVGLKKLLGVWYNSDNVMDFKNYTDLRVYPLARLLASDRFSPGTDIRYSMAPYNGNQWAIFLSSAQATIFATLELGIDVAKLRLFNSDTGENTETVVLTRWRK